MNYFKLINRFPFLKLTLITGATIFISSCSMLQSGLQTKIVSDETIAQAPQFIEDFYAIDSTADASKPRISNAGGDMCAAHRCEADAEQKDNYSLYAYEDQNNNNNINIGGEDYATPEEAEEFEVYDELFLFNELNAGETFDPEKMTDSIPVYLISPWSNCYTFPLAQSKINSDFGWRRSRFHSGIDLDLEIGDAVVASFDGIVKKADYTSGYGNLVVVKHFNGLETYYAHLSKLMVKEGDTLTAGEELGLGGSTGRSTGPHLHYEIRYRGAAIDPKNIVNFKDENIKSDLFYLKKEHFRPAVSKTTSTTTVAGKKYYTIRKGDTLGKIASRNGTTVSKICKLNGISSKKLLKPGQKLRIK